MEGEPGLAEVGLSDSEKLGIRQRIENIGNLEDSESLQTKLEALEIVRSELNGALDKLRSETGSTHDAPDDRYKWVQDCLDKINDILKELPRSI